MCNSCNKCNNYNKCIECNNCNKCTKSNATVISVITIICVISVKSIKWHFEAECPFTSMDTLNFRSIHYWPFDNSVIVVMNPLTQRHMKPF